MDSTPTRAAFSQLVDLCRGLLSQRRLLIASNRGPIEYTLYPDGQLQARRSGTGHVSILNALGHHQPYTWIQNAMSEGDRRASEQAQGRSFPSPIPGQRLNLRFVVPNRNTYHKYYNIFCHPLLWFLQHYMWNPSYTPTVDAKVYDAWENGYVQVNQAFADAVVDELKDEANPPLVMLEDFHLYLAGGFIKQRLPQALLLHFSHLPWPGPDYWLLLPAPMRSAICRNLLAHDILGFQTLRDARNFLRCAETFVEGVEVDYRALKATCEGQQTWLRVYPLSIDVAEFQRLARSPRVKEFEEQLRGQGQTIVRVDRAEPNRNILRGFRSFEMLLERYPELRGQVRFLAFLVPTRTHLKQYQRYLQEISETAEAVNGKFGTASWKPIVLYLENNYLQALAGLRLYDVLLVNSVIDGIGLVAKEGPVVNTRDGSLVLSEGVGAQEQLKANVFSVSPSDLEGTMQALHQALTLGAEERGRRAAAIKAYVEREDAVHWLAQQFQDFQALVQERCQPAVGPAPQEAVLPASAGGISERLAS